MTKTMLAVVTSAALLSPLAGPAFAQQGTTLAGPSQGSKMNGESSTRPSGSGAGANAGGSATTGVQSGATQGEPSATGAGRAAGTGAER